MPDDESEAPHVRARPRLFRYGLAVVSIALATWVRLLLDPALGYQLPYPTLLLAVMLTAWYGGVRPASVAVILGALSANYFLVLPRGGFGLTDAAQYVDLALYLCVGAGIAVLGRAPSAGIRKLTETREALAQDAARLRRHAEAIGVWSWNIAENVLEADETCLVLFGLPAGHVLQTFEEFACLVHPDDRRRVQDEILASVENGAAYRTGFRALLPEGVVRSMASRGKVYYSEAGRPLRLTGVVWDVTERLEAEQSSGAAEQQILTLNRRLEEAAAQSEAANRAKSAFLSTMAHEIRTPMNAILGYAQLMSRDPDLGTAARTNLGIIGRSGEHLLGLINGALETYRIDGSGGVGVPLGRSAPCHVIGIRGGAPVPGILIVDDQLENRDWLMKLLEVIGFSVRGAENGEAAIQAWEEWSPGLILMDVRMPVMDGLEATRRIKADPRGKETAIVALTGGTMEEDRRAIFHSGADDFLPKPCREDELLERIRTLLNISYEYEEGNVPEAGVAESARAPRQFAGKQEGRALSHSDIMIVDDNPANLRLLERMLRQQGHEVRSFPLGRLALIEAANNPPDLILLDIDMPEMNGYEVCERLKTTPGLGDIPVIFLSALNQVQDKVRAFGAGGVDYISKPFQFEEVHARVETHLRLHDLQAAMKLQNERLEEAVAMRTQELAGANQRLTLLDRSKDEFLNLISHEFRTPLNGILGIGQLILEGLPPTEKNSRFRQMFERSRRRILSIMDDALLLTQLGAGGERFKLTPVSLSEALICAVERTSAFAESRGVAFEPPPADLCLVMGQEDLLVKALSALLETAVKFSEKGETVRLAREALPDSLSLLIESDGGTIPGAALAKFFDLFSIGEAITAGGDLGLGPPVAYRILMLFGASVSVANRDPSGIRLTISLPATPGSPDAPSDA